jgi:hypothetical protein
MWSMVKLVIFSIKRSCLFFSYHTPKPAGKQAESQKYEYNRLLTSFQRLVDRRFFKN